MCCSCCCCSSCSKGATTLNTLQTSNTKSSLITLFLLSSLSLTHTLYHSPSPILSLTHIISFSLTTQDTQTHHISDFLGHSLLLLLTITVPCNFQYKHLLIAQRFVLTSISCCLSQCQKKEKSFLIEYSKTVFLSFLKGKR